MDESWRTTIGSIVPRRRSAAENPRQRLDPDDFRDVFGGPPRTLLLRRLSGEFAPRQGSFYDEVFRPTETHGGGGGRILPGFRIPAAAGRAGRVRTEEGFYDDIFGSDSSGRGDGGDWRSRSRSKSGSSSERSPSLRAAILAEDPMLTSFASKLRPIAVPSSRHGSSPPSTFSTVEQSGQQNSSVRCPLRSGFLDIQCSSASSLAPRRSHATNNYFCCFSPPETLSLEHSFHGRSISKQGGDDSGINSPSSVISSFFLEPVASNAMSHESWQQVELEPEKVVLEVEEREAIESSYVIEIDSSGGGEEVRGEAAVDEAIAWAKEKFWSHVRKSDEPSDEKNEAKAEEKVTERKESSSRKEPEGLQIFKEHQNLT